MISNINSFTYLEDVTVNTENGNVAISYFNGENVVVKVFNSNGDFLFGKKFDSAGGSSSYVEYVDGNLNVFVSRTNTQYEFDNSGNELKAVEYSNEKYDIFIQFNGSNPKSFQNNDVKYCYEESNLLSRIFLIGYVKFYIEDSEGNIRILFEDS